MWLDIENLNKGEEINEKELKWEQRVAKKYWDKLFTEYAICDLTYFKSEFSHILRLITQVRKSNRFPLANWKRSYKW